MGDIKFTADTSELKEARDDLTSLGSTLKDLAVGSNLNIGGAGKGAEQIRALADSVSRLTSISRRGNESGGLLSKEQMNEAIRLSKQINTGMSQYTNEIKKARQEMAALAKERAVIEKKMDPRSGKFISFSEFETSQVRLQEIQQRETSAKKDLYQLTNQQNRLSGVISRADLAGNSVGAMGIKGGEASLNGVMASTLKKAIGMGMALVGAGTIIGFLRGSMSSAANVGGGESDLSMRGYKPFNPASYGFKGSEHLAVAESLSGGTGYKGDSLATVVETAKAATRAMGTDSSVVTTFMNSAFQATGFSAAQLKESTNTMFKMSRAIGAEGRIVDLLAANQSLLSHATQQTSGKELSGGQVGYLQNLQMQAWSMPGMMGKGQNASNLLNQFSSSIAGEGGTPGQQAFMFSALGGNKISSVSDYYDFQRRKQRGLADPQNASMIFDKLKGTYGTTETGELNKKGKLALARGMMGGNIEAAEFISSLEHTGAFKGGKGSLESSLKRKLKAEGLEGTDLETAARKAMGLEGNKHRSTESTVDDFITDIGKKLLPVIDELKTRITEFANAVKDGKDLVEAMKKLTSSNEGMGVAGVGALAGGYGLYRGAKYLKGLIPSGAGAGAAAVEGTAFNASNAARAASFAEELAPAAGGLSKIATGAGRFLGPVGLATTAYSAYKDVSKLPSKVRKEWAMNSRIAATRKAAQKYGIDPYLINAIIEAESGGDPRAKSKAGAMGLMQLMPGTAAGMGLKGDDVYDVEKNIMGGAQHLAGLFKRNPGASIAKILTMYNWGEGNYKKKGGFANSPVESRKYVREVDKHYSDLKGSSFLEMEQSTTPAANMERWMEPMVALLAMIERHLNHMSAHHQEVSR